MLGRLMIIRSQNLNSIKGLEPVEVNEEGIHEVIFDINKNLLHKIPSDEEVAHGVAEYNAGRMSEYIITIMNDPSVVERFKAGQESA